MMVTLCNNNVHLLEELDICGGVGALEEVIEGWFPVPFDGPIANYC